MIQAFKGVNRLFVLLYEYKGDRIVETGYHIPKVEIKDENIIIDGQNIFNQPGQNDIGTYDNIWKIATG